MNKQKTMERMTGLMSHLAVILSLMFLVFLVLDQFNPLMNFIDNGISRVLLAALCILGIARSLTGWHAEDRARRTEKGIAQAEEE